jgi:hypothetical protein
MASQPPEKASKAQPKRDPWGCMAGTVTIMPGVDLTAPTEEAWNAEKHERLTDKADDQVESH